MNERAPGSSISPFVPAIAAAWLSYVAIDFLTHAVVLASWWRATAPFWLPPMQLLRRIPFGYLSFALYATALVWVMRKVIGDRPAPARALRFATLAGLLFGGVQGFANYSVFRMPPSAMLVWPVSVAVASAAAGVAAASVLGAGRPWRRLLLMFFLALGIIILGVVLQNLIVPTSADHLAL